MSQIVGNTVVTVQGLMLAVCDEKSNALANSLNDAAWASVRSTTSGRLFEYNTYLADKQREGLHAAWALLLWGTFRIDVVRHVDAETFAAEPHLVHLVGNVSESVLELPSGHLGLLDVELTTWRPIAHVPPGRYRIRITGNEEPSHWDIASPTDYPLQDRDWVVHLLRE